MTKRIVKINELAEILATTEVAIRSHLQRKNYDAIPKPMRLGRRLVWSARKVEEFIASKEERASTVGCPKKKESRGDSNREGINVGVRQ